MRERLELQVALNNRLALFTLSLGENGNVLRNLLTYFWLIEIWDRFHPNLTSDKHTWSSWYWSNIYFYHAYEQRKFVLKMWGLF